MSECCVVVGAGPGLSAAIARRFAGGGFPVALIARRPESLRALAESLDGTTATAPADAGDPDAVAAAIADVVGRLGDPGVLVYNAAALHGDRPEELTPAELAATLRVNVGGALAAARAVVQPMRRRGRGTILFTGGGLAMHPSPAYTSLSVGKAAIRALALVLHDAWGPDGVHVGTVTIAGFIRPSTHFAPEAIAEAYWRLHVQPPGEWDAELVYS